MIRDTAPSPSPSQRPLDRPPVPLNIHPSNAAMLGFTRRPSRCSRTPVSALRPPLRSTRVKFRLDTQGRTPDRCSSRPVATRPALGGRASGAVLAPADVGAGTLHSDPRSSNVPDFVYRLFAHWSRHHARCDAGASRYTETQLPAAGAPPPGNALLFPPRGSGCTVFPRMASSTVSTP